VGNINIFMCNKGPAKTRVDALEEKERRIPGVKEVQGVQYLQIDIGRLFLLL
jgi:hypothetical protein